MGLNHNGECGISKYQAYIKEPTLIKEFIVKCCYIISISCGDYHSCCIEGFKTINGIWTFGKNNYKQCDTTYDYSILIPKIHKAFLYKNIIKGKCGKDFTICLSDNGILSTFGNILIEYDDIKLMKMNNYIKDFVVANDHIIIINHENKISIVQLSNNEYNSCLSSGKTSLSSNNFINLFLSR